MSGLGTPRVHLRRVGSTNEHARELAGGGAPHGTLVTAAEQTSGRGRQGRTWTAPAGRALLMSLVLRSWAELLPLAAGLAVADVVAGDARVKWPNDVLLGGRKVAGVLVEGRPNEGWMVLGIGLNVAVAPDDLPTELRGTATGMGLEPSDVELVLARLLATLERRLGEKAQDTVAALRERDALAGREVNWADGSGRADGIDESGGLRVVLPDGSRRTLAAGEVHLGAQSSTE